MSAPVLRITAPGRLARLRLELGPDFRLSRDARAEIAALLLSASEVARDVASRRRWASGSRTVRLALADAGVTASCCWAARVPLERVHVVAQRLAAIVFEDTGTRCNIERQQSREVA